ncbi:glycosyl transferase family 2 [Trypanosoma cruzi]|nr:glycosyl transferase family 2 [Trypanosoma cruzi]
MYANMDILLASSLANTLDKAQQCLRERRKKWKKKKFQNLSYQGWFLVGRRINVDVPANCSMDTENWDSAIEAQLKSQGTMFSSDAEDSVAMSVDLFNLYETPPFIVGGIVFDSWLKSRAKHWR